MNTEADTQLSELKERLLSKTAELEIALASITELTRKLNDSGSSLQTAQDALTASDVAATVRDTQLKTAEDALAISDKALELKTTELFSAIESLALANEKLRHSRDLQNAFINIAAHELKNPVQPLLSIAEYLEMLNHKEIGTDKIEVSRSDIEMIVRNAKRLEHLANDILDVSRVETNSLRLKKEKFDLNREIRDVVRDFQMFGSKSQGVQISLNLHSPERVNVVYADKSRIYEVISNILGNAIKFTKQGCVTIISAIGKDKESVVRIKDTGKGISPELLPELFSKFGVDQAFDSDSGSGLGLFISKGIIGAHGGKMWAENNKDGKGATFTFTIPAEKS